jgi:hypothetical protein
VEEILGALVFSIHPETDRSALTGFIAAKKAT